MSDQASYVEAPRPPTPRPWIWQCSRCYHKNRVAFGGRCIYCGRKFLYSDKQNPGLKRRCENFLHIKAWSRWNGWDDSCKALRVGPYATPDGPRDPEEANRVLNRMEQERNDRLFHGRHDCLRDCHEPGNCTEARWYYLSFLAQTEETTQDSNAEDSAGRLLMENEQIDPNLDAAVASCGSTEIDVAADRDGDRDGDVFVFGDLDLEWDTVEDAEEDAGTETDSDDDVGTDNGTDVDIDADIDPETQNDPEADTDARMDLADRRRRWRHRTRRLWI